MSVILLVDLFLLPWILKFPSFLFGSGEIITTAPSRWIDYGPWKSIEDVLMMAQFRKVYIIMQLPVIALIIGISWDVNKFKKENRITDGVGGPEPAGNGQHGTSRWQNQQEMDQTANVWYPSNEAIQKGGIIFGMEKYSHGKEKIWFDEDDVHTLIIGATRSGKSRKIIIPSIWEMGKSGESMVIGDPKGELYIYTRDYLKNQGYNVITLNLREPSKGNQWNMLDLVNKAVDDNNISRATELAWDIAHTIANQSPTTSSDPLWRNGEESTIAALILLTALNSESALQRHMTTAYFLLAEYGQPLKDESIPLLNYLNKELEMTHPARSAFATASIAPYKIRSSFFTTALSDLRLFSDPNISDMTAIQDHELAKIGIEKTAVFLIVPDEKGTRNVLATLYIDQVYAAMVDLANKKGGRIPRRVNFILDEFGNLPSIPEFDKKITVAGGRGMRFTLAIQDIAQLKKLYDSNAQTITGNCHNWIYLKTADIETAKLISEKTGKYTVETENSSSSVQPKSHSISHGVGLAQRALLLPDEVLRWNINESLILPISSFAARYPLPDLSLWQANEDLGFVRTGNIDEDKELNRQIIVERLKNTPARQPVKLQRWLPGGISNTEKDEEVAREDILAVKEEKVIKAKVESVLEKHQQKVAASKDSLKIDIRKKKEVRPHPIGAAEVSIDDLIGNAQTIKKEKDSEEDNFL